MCKCGVLQFVFVEVKNEDSVAFLEEVSSEAAADALCSWS